MYSQFEQTRTVTKKAITFFLIYFLTIFYKIQTFFLNKKRFFNKKRLNFVKFFETLKHRVNLGRTGTWNWNFFKIFF